MTPEEQREWDRANVEAGYMPVKEHVEKYRDQNVTDMTPERLAEIKARADAATEGPWWTDARWSEEECGTSIIAARTDCGELPGNPSRGQVAFATQMLPANARRCERDAVFIAHARTDIPDLLATITGLQAEVERHKSECASYWVSADMRPWVDLAESKGLGHFGKKLKGMFSRAIKAEQSSVEAHNKIEFLYADLTAAQARVKKLTDMHEQFESLVGVARLHMTEDQKARINKYMIRLDEIEFRHLKNIRADDETLEFMGFDPETGKRFRRNFEGTQP